VAGTSQYFERDPDVASKPRTVELVLPDGRLELQTDRGVFSATAVDAGTKLLLLEATEVPGDARDLVDLGCGYGPIALTLARRAPNATVWAVDVNQRALALCAANAKANGLSNLRTVAPDGMPGDVRAQGIWSNPPIRIGKIALHDLLSTWLARLDDGASAWLVVQKHLGSDSLAGWLEESGWSAQRTVSRSGYRVLQVTPA